MRDRISRILATFQRLGSQCGLALVTVLWVLVLLSLSQHKISVLSACRSRIIVSAPPRRAVLPLSRFLGSFPWWCTTRTTAPGKATRTCWIDRGLSPTLSTSFLWLLSFGRNNPGVGC